MIDFKMILTKLKDVCPFTDFEIMGDEVAVIIRSGIMVGLAGEMMESW